MKNYLVLGMAIALSACASNHERINTIHKTPLGTQVEPPANCPDWSQPVELNYSNVSMSNFGCSSITNYGLMIERPEDMIKGRSTDLNNASHAVRAVTAYETGAISSSGGSSSGSGSSTSSSGGQ